VVQVVVVPVVALQLEFKCSESQLWLLISASVLLSLAPLIRPKLSLKDLRKLLSQIFLET
jgi:hypothetical protein